MSIDHYRHRLVTLGSALLARIRFGLPFGYSHTEVHLLRQRTRQCLEQKICKTLYPNVK